MRMGTIDAGEHGTRKAGMTRPRIERRSRIRPSIRAAAASAALTVLSWFAAPAVAYSSPHATAQEARNKATAARVFTEIFNQGKFHVANEIYAPNFVNHLLHRDATLQEDQNAVHAEKNALPDLKMTVNLVTAKDNLVTVIWTLRGTHRGWGLALPPTGAKLELRGITLWRLAGGKISEEWSSFNELSAYMQVADQLRWQILGALCALLLLGVLLERVLLETGRVLWQRLRRVT